MGTCQTKPIDFRDLPEDAQQEVYDFYLFMKQRAGESALLSEKSLAEDWEKPEENQAGKSVSIEKINACLAKPERV